ncbi:bcl-2-related ovarian killer protein homolog B-like [Haliotis rufescens]|uniref:bcl-2-related ovarian killer protein homolog B-like n=1 Tax=Haliotis rufescens TaxID=6454 RepID=UPI00201F595E|nr:bcl-2-related ovarian killer protein homolog B-like [Haliotis rufescens]
MAVDDRARFSASRRQRTNVMTAVKADDSTRAGADVTAWIVVCLTNYVKKVLSFVMESFGMETSSELRLPQSTSMSVMEQAKHICKDYTYHRLSEKDMTKKLTFVGYNSVLSESYINAGEVLEKMYPRVYTDVSRKIGRTMSSTSIVKATLNDVLDILFRDSITWGKIVSMFAISSSFAEECVQQGHPDFVNDVVDTVGGFVVMHLVEWLVKQGGWKGLDNAFKENKDVISPTLLIGIIGAVVGAVVGVVTVTMSCIVELR